MCGALPSCLTPFVEVTRLPHWGSYILKQVVFLYFFTWPVVRKVKIARLEFHLSVADIRNAWSSVPTAHPTSSWRGPYLSLVAATTVPSSRSQTMCCCAPNRPALKNSIFASRSSVILSALILVGS